MRKTILLSLALVLISPIFGVILAEHVGYHEPLDLAAELVGLEDVSERINWTPLMGYSIPNIPDSIGYAISGLIGVTTVIALGKIIARVLAGRGDDR